MPETLPAPQPIRIDDLEFVHVVCDCDTDWALCGKDVTEARWRLPGEVEDCVVCEDLEIYECQRCGR